MNLSELFDIKDKVALITGGGRGIGKAIAEIYGEAGAKVIITGRRDEWLAPTQKELQDKGYTVSKIVADVSKTEDIERTVKTVLEEYGQIDILVNNAGQTWGAATVDMPLNKWQQIMDVNVTGIFLMCQLVGRHMIERGKGGRIINIASVAGLVTNSTDMMSTIAYNTSKGALITFTRNLAREWGRNGIMVNAIAPGFFPTRMASGTIEANKERVDLQTALGRVGDLEELKGAALLLASPAASYITGEILKVDGGISL